VRQHNECFFESSETHRIRLALLFGDDAALLFRYSTLLFGQLVHLSQAGDFGARPRERVDDEIHLSLTFIFVHL
jgi:hypothetical protein